MRLGSDRCLNTLEITEDSSHDDGWKRNGDRRHVVQAMIHKASSMNFDARRAGIGIVYVGNYNPSEQPPLSSIPDGCNATLKWSQATILIKSVMRTATGTFIGEIYGFEPDTIPSQTGMKVEDSIEFHESHIFGVQV